MNTYTVFAEWTPSQFASVIEELDVEAGTYDEAVKLATEQLDRDYEPGWEIVGVEKRHGLFI